MARLLDLLPPEVQARYPLETLDPRRRALLTQNLPGEPPPEVAVALRSRLLQKLPTWTLPVPPIDSAAHAADEYRRQSPHMKAALRIGQGIRNAAPSLAGTSDPRVIPEPTSTAERVLEGVGGMATFGTLTAAGTMLGIPAPLAMGAAAAAPAGTPKERAIRGIVTTGVGAAVPMATSAAMAGAQRVVAAQAPQFARAAAAAGEGTGQAMLAEGAKRATGFVSGVGQAASLGANVAGFGVAQPYAEYAAHSLTGDDVVAPRLEDMVASGGLMLGAGLAHAAIGMRPGAPRAAATPPTSRETPVRAAEAAPRPQPAVPAAPTPNVPRATPKPVQGDARRVAIGIFRGLDADRPVKMDGGRTQLGAAWQRLNDAMPENATPEQVRELASRVRAEVRGVADVSEALDPPAGMTPTVLSTGEKFAEQVAQFVGERQITLLDSKQRPVAGRVAAIKSFPGPEVEYPLRVVLAGPDGRLRAFRFRSNEEFVAKVQGLERQQGVDLPPGPPQQGAVSGPATPAATATEQALEPAAPPPAVSAPKAPRLGTALAGAKPRYAFGPKQFEVEFENDIDRAAYIAAQKKPSKRDAEYRKFLRDQGFGDAEIAAHGQRVRGSLKEMARGGDPAKGALKVKRHERQVAPAKAEEARAVPEPARSDAEAGAVRPIVNGMVVTASGRQIPAPPRIRLDSDRKATTDLKKQQEWLQREAIAEAIAQGNEHVRMMFEREVPGRLPPATVDSMNDVLFGETTPTFGEGPGEAVAAGGVTPDQAPLTGPISDPTNGRLKVGSIVKVPYYGRSKKRVTDNATVIGFTGDGKAIVRMRVGGGKVEEREMDPRLLRKKAVRKGDAVTNKPVGDRVAARATKAAGGSLEAAHENVGALKAEHDALYEIARDEYGKAGGSDSPEYRKARRGMDRVQQEIRAAERVVGELEGKANEGYDPWGGPAGPKPEVTFELDAHEIGEAHRSAVLARVGDGRIRDNGRAVRRRVSDWLEAVRTSGGNQDDLPFALWSDMVGAVGSHVGSLAVKAKLQGIALARVAEKHKGGDLKGLRRTLKALEREVVQARALKADVDARVQRAIADAKAGKKPLADGLYAVQQYVDTKLRFRADETGGTIIFHEFAKMLGEGMTRVRKGLERGMGRVNTHVRIVDRAGNVRERIPVNGIDEDTYSTEPLVRAMARLGIGATGDRILPPQQAREFISGKMMEVLLSEDMALRIERVFGSPAALAYFAKGGTGSEQLALALEGKPHAIPQEHRGVVARYRELTDDLHLMDVDHALAMGQPPPKYRKNYMAHLSEYDIGREIKTLWKSIKKRGDDEVGEDELRDVANRFLNERHDDPRYQKDAMYALEARVRASVRKIAMDPAIQSLNEYLQSPEVLVGKDRTRGELVRAWAESVLFGEKDRLSLMLDAGLQRALFRSAGEGVRPVSPAVAAQALKWTPETLEASGFKAFAVVDRGVEPDFTGGLWEEIAALPDGERVMASKKAGAKAFNPKSAVPRALVARWYDMLERFDARTKKRQFGEAEAARRARWKRERKEESLLRDPLNGVVTPYAARESKALLGYNLGYSMVNAGQVLMTLTEHGPRPFITGMIGAGRASVQSSRRAHITALEVAKVLTAEQAAAMRDRIPLLREEVVAEGLWANLGETQQIQARISDMADGKNPAVERLKRAIGPYGMAASVEGWSRTVSVLAAMERARALGMTPRQEHGVMVGTVTNRVAMLREIAGEITDPLSPEGYAARSIFTDAFGYNEMGRSILTSSGWGKIAFKFSHWAFENMARYGARPAYGAYRVTKAAARGAVGAKPQAPYDTRGHTFRAKEPPPGNWFEDWLEANGAAYSHRHAGAVFLRQMALGAVLVGLTDLTGVNAAVFGISPSFVAGLWLLRQFFKDDEQLVEWLKIGSDGSSIQFRRGLGLALLPVGPTVSALSDATRAIPPAARKFEKAHDSGTPAAQALAEAMPSPLNDALEIVRWQVNGVMIGGHSQMKKLIQEHPALVDQYAPWLYKAMGVETVQRDLTLPGKVKHQLRLDTREERDAARERVRD